MAGAGVGAAAMAEAREHIEEMRRERFSIGGMPNPLSEAMHHAVTYLSAELYAKDVHFLMELIQNAEDNKYPEGVEPSLEFVITSKDITATGAPATLLIFNNERGFSRKDIDSICYVGGSSKKGNRQQGYIGEKGIGFKSVFLITSRPYIFSNGYQIRFSEEPHPDCKLGYIIPEWVEEHPTLSEIGQIYGSDNIPTTTMVLPLKSEKVKAVKQQLSGVHPEVLLFLSKIKHLSVREDNKDPKRSTVSAISITSETDHVVRKNINAVSYTIHLSAEENFEGIEKQCHYYMWRQKFPVNPENQVERRMEVEEWSITLAFPYGERLNRGMTSPGVYAFLPTEMVTNFPFIIQADFVLASSRETILLDNKWNTGILDCVPSAFVEALCSLAKPLESAHVSSLTLILEFLPVETSSYSELNAVREAIKEKLADKSILPGESYSKQLFFHQSKEVCRLKSGFWNILFKARKQGVTLHNLSSHGVYILNSVFDDPMYDRVLEFLGVGYVNNDWYSKCVKSPNLVMGVSEDVYLELLYFFASNWNICFRSAGVETVPLLKYVGLDGKVSLWSMNRASQHSERICLSYEREHISWLIDWNKEFRCIAERFFMPKTTQEHLKSFSHEKTLAEWLRQYASVEAISVHDYCRLHINEIRTDRKLVVSFTHFLYHSLSKSYLADKQVRQLCDSMPVIDTYGRVITLRRGLLIPGKGSKWISVLGSNPWTQQNYIELGQDYVSGNYFANMYTHENQLMTFLRNYTEASDIPDLCPPDAPFSSINSPLTKANALLLLEWIRSLRIRGCIPSRFSKCIKEGHWLKTSAGYKAPEESFLSNSSWGDLLQVGSELVDIPLVEQWFYDNKIMSYREELKTLGVMFEFAEACQFIGKELMSRAESSNLPRNTVLYMLKFIRFLREKYLSPEEFIRSVKDRRWLKTSNGYRSPVGSMLFDPSWKAALPVTNLSFIDESFYGEDISAYKNELQLLGVVVEFDLQIVADNFSLPAQATSLPRETVLLILECIRKSTSSNQLVGKLKSYSWIRTLTGLKPPSESFLLDPEWGCMLKIIYGLPLIDESYYGSDMHLYKSELEKLGVIVSFSDASKAVASRFKQLVSSFALTKVHVLSLLSCFKHLKDAKHRSPAFLSECVRTEKWVQTRLGLKTPEDSILFDSEWEAISPIARLPFIDDSESGYGKAIHMYKEQLEEFGVVVEVKSGSRFVASGLNIPPTQTDIKPATVIALLKCVKSLREENVQLSKDFMKEANKKWVKTHMGFRSPTESLLFQSSFDCSLHPEDGPFIDEIFYGSEIRSFDQELEAIGVTKDAATLCSLLAGNLSYHTDLTVITRIYTYLSERSWQPDNKGANWIWIPNGSEGQWASPVACVLHDQDNLFGSKLNVLDKYYEKPLLSFFSFAFGVRSNPSIEDYCKLWSEWEGREEPLALSYCCSFWVFMSKYWSKKTEKLLSEGLVKLPAGVGLRDVQLIDKKDVFIPDDLQLKDIFEKTCSSTVFVWHPQPILPSLSRSKLNEIYKSIGVQTISESVVKGEVQVPKGIELKAVGPSELLNMNGLLKIILGFLSDSSLDLSLERRHQVAKYLFNVTVVETEEPIKVNYSLRLSSGETICVKASRMIRWERENSKLYIQKLDWSSTRRASIEFATHFSEVISEGLLWETPEQIDNLALLIKLACLLDFEEDAVEYLLKTRNMQVFMEDEEFLSSALASTLSIV